MDPRIKEFQCIMPLENIPSVVEHGILSFERAAKLKHHSVAMTEVQDRRDKRHVPGGLKLHQYANLYFHARNPMLYKRKDEAANICVLRVSTAVLQNDGVVITDCNAASNYVRFYHPSQLSLLDFNAIFAMSWTHQNDPIAQLRHRSQKCAEILIPNFVDPRFLVGAYVVSESVAARLSSCFACPITIDRNMFFR
jgi:hypothetical protein